MSRSAPAPRVGKHVYIAPTAYVGGDVVLGDECTILHHVAIRGDNAPIRIGERTNIQDGAVLHTALGVPLEIDANVVIGHRAVVHCRSVASWSLIGVGAIVLDGARIGPACLVAAGAVVTPQTEVPPGKLVAGVPARVIRDTTEAERADIRRIVAGYVELGARYAAGDLSRLVAAEQPRDGESGV